ncbi:hypothetical protein CDD83_559 [Cordyceps sp. RAO-2017]|nr:hypothetical protein CDD83_559 [Cordyceps sp. RAO-2017]
MDVSEIDELIAAGSYEAQYRAQYIEIAQALKIAIASSVLITILVCAVVLGRLLSRAFIVKHFGADDALALSALIIFIPFSAITIEYFVATAHPGTPESISLAIEYAVFPLYCTTLVLTRVSGLAFYYRICHLYQEFLVTIKVVFGILVAGYVVEALLLIFHCWPLTSLFHSRGYACFEDGCFTCFVTWFHASIAISTISFVSDLLLFSLPVAMLRALPHMPRKQKMQLACILLPGFAVVGISISLMPIIVRMHYFQNERQLDMNLYQEFIKTNVLLYLLQNLEISAMLIAISLPGLKPLVDKYCHEARSVARLVRRKERPEMVLESSEKAPSKL